MAEDVPSLSSGIVGSRFVSSDEIEEAKSRRQLQWEAAYARLGQEPPPQQQEDSYDGRSLAEKLAANRVAKQEEWEEKTKLANQFRALEEDEIMFLDSIREKEEAEEKARRVMDGEEVKSFKEAVAARSSASNPPPSVASSSSVNPSAAKKDSKPTVLKKDVKKPLLKGVVVKKKGKSAAAAAKPLPSSVPLPAEKSTKKKKPNTDAEDGPTGDEPTAKRRRISESES